MHVLVFENVLAAENALEAVCVNMKAESNRSSCVFQEEVCTLLGTAFPVQILISKYGQGLLGFDPTVFMKTMVFCVCFLNEQTYTEEIPGFYR